MSMFCSNDDLLFLILCGALLVGAILIGDSYHLRCQKVEVGNQVDEKKREENE